MKNLLESNLDQDLDGKLFEIMDLITRLRSGHDHLKIVLGDLLKRIQLTNNRRGAREGRVEGGRGRRRRRNSGSIQGLCLSRASQSYIDEGGAGVGRASGTPTLLPPTLRVH